MIALAYVLIWHEEEPAWECDSKRFAQLAQFHVEFTRQAVNFSIKWSFSFTN